MKIPDIRNIESVGWIFFGFVFVLLVVPACLLVWNYTYDTVTTGTRIAVGVVMGIVGAAIIASIVNSVLQWRVQRRQTQLRKEKKKSKKTH